MGHSVSMYEDSLFKAIDYFGSQQALADALGVSQQAVNHWLNRNKKIPVLQALKIAVYTQGKVTLRELTDEESELTLLLEHTLLSNPMPFVYLTSADIRCGDKSCPIYKHIDKSLSISNPDFIRPIVVDLRNRLITCECRLRAHQQLGHRRIKVYRLDIHHILKQGISIAPFIRDFPLSERVDIGLYIEQELGNRQGKRLDLKLPENSSEVMGYETRKIAATVSGFGNDFSYRQAKGIVKRGIPELIRAVNDGLLAISKAQKIADLPEHEQLSFVSAMQRKNNP